MRTVAFTEVNPQLLAQLSRANAQPIEATQDAQSVILLPPAEYDRLQCAARERFEQTWDELAARQRPTVLPKRS